MSEQQTQVEWKCVYKPNLLGRLMCCNCGLDVVISSSFKLMLRTYKKHKKSP